MKFIYYYKMYNGSTEVHEYPVHALNLEAANLKWHYYKKLHEIVDVTNEEREKRKQMANEELH